MSRVLLVLALLAPSLASAQAAPCVGHSRDEVRRCRIIDAELRLAEVEAEIAASGHADDTAAAWMLALGVPALVGGLVGAVVAGMTSRCTEGGGSSYVLGGGSGGGCVARDEPWPTIAGLTGIAGAGLVAVIVGAVWLAVNGRPFRERAQLQLRIERMRASWQLDASVAPGSAVVFVGAAF